MRIVAGDSVLITGGSSGIGAAIAALYAARGARLCLVARNEQRLQAMAETLRGQGAAGVDVLPTDLSDSTEATRVLSEYVQRAGLPRLVVCAAGVVRPGAFVELSPEAFAENLRCDFDACVNVCRVFAAPMAARGSGQLALVSSMAGFLGIYGYSGYAAAKFALMGFAEALRFELRPAGVSVSVLCPPDTDTPGFAAECRERPHETSVISGAIRPVPAEYVARVALRGFDRDKAVIIPGMTGKFYYRLKGLWPELYRAIVDGDVRRAQRELRERPELAQRQKENV